MKKKILVLTGSPRNGGNSDLMADAFIRGAQANGHDVVKVKTDEKIVRGCKACRACYSKGAACVFDDDFNEIAPLLENSDVVAVATPVYWYTFPAQLKVVIDKMVALYNGGKSLSEKECVLMACAEENNPEAFEGLTRSWDLIRRLLKWTEKGRLIVPGVNDVGDIKKTDALDKAETLGAQLS
jgi:multimeric flavodoxin WrbA